MEQIVTQLGQLFLAAVPTVIIVFLFYLFLKWSFFGTIERVLHERAAKIEELQKRPAWRELEAVKAGRVLLISSEVDRPAPKLK